jgi:hypothetical protein
VPGGSHAAHPPFPFIVGAPRSGTTVLRLMVDAHPAMAVPPESYFPVTLWPWRRRYLVDGGFRLDLLAEDLLTRRPVPRAPFNWDIDPGLVRERLSGVAPISYPEAIRMVYALYAEVRGKPRYGDKTPIFADHLGLLARLFPEARFLHVIRDGRDVALSVVDKRWGARTLVEAAAQWALRVRTTRRAGRTLGDRYVELMYEDLVADPQPILQRVCAFTELDYRPEMLSFHLTAEQRLPEWERRSHDDLGRPLTAGLRNWRSEMSRNDIAAVEVVAGRTLESLGYERVTRRPDGAAVARGLAAVVRLAGGRAARAAGRGISRVRWSIGSSSGATR